MIHKLRLQFIRIAMLSVTLVLIGLIGVVNMINFASTNSDLNHLLTVISDNGGLVPGFPDDKRGERRKDMHFTAETPFSTRYFVLHYTADGTLLGFNLDHIAAVTVQDAEAYVDIALKRGEGTGYKDSYIYRITQVKNGEFMAVFLNCQDELHSLQTYAIASVGAGLSCIVLVYILILFFSKKAITPTVQSIEKQKQFITDASHELKTPLTVISTSQKVLEMEVGQQKWIDKTLAQVDKMRNLVDELVTLSRLDEERPPLQITQFNVSEAVGETSESFREYASAQGHPLELEVAPDICFCGDQLSVRYLVSVLMDNAVKYCAEGGTIRLTLAATKRGIQLTVRNDCQPIDPAELEKLFDRFYRVDKSRSRQTGGFGVGLSIARGIVETHHGSIKAACPDEHSIVFTATLNNLKLPKEKAT